MQNNVIHVRYTHDNCHGNIYNKVRRRGAETGVLILSCWIVSGEATAIRLHVSRNLKKEGKESC